MIEMTYFCECHVTALKFALGLNRLGRKVLACAAKVRLRSTLSESATSLFLYGSEHAFHNLVASSQETTTATTYSWVTTFVARHVSHNSFTSML